MVKTAPEFISTVPRISRKKARIKKRTQLRDQKRQLDATIKVANTKIRRDEPNPVDPERVNYYRRGEGIGSYKGIKVKYFKKKFENREKKIEWAAEQSARTEILLTEQSG